MTTLKPTVITDPHNWIQSSKSRIGSTILVCTTCNLETPASEMCECKPCVPRYEYKSAGFADKTLKYWWIHLARGTHSHCTMAHDFLEFLKLAEANKDRLCVRVSPI